MIIKDADFNAIEKLIDKTPITVGHACSSPPSRVYTAFLNIFGFRKEYYHQYGSTLLKGWLIQKALSKESDTLLIKRIEKVWVSALFNPIQTEAENYIRAERFLLTYASETGDFAKAIQLEQALHLLKTTFYDKKSSLAEQENALRHLITISQAKKIYTQLSNDSQLVFLKIIEGGNLEAKIQAFDIIQLKSDKPGNLSHVVTLLQKVAHRSDLASIVKNDSEIFYYGYVHPTPAYIMNSVSPDVKEALGGDYTPRIEDLRAQLDAIKQTLDRVETYPSLKRDVINFLKNPDSIPGSDIQIRLSVVNTRLTRILDDPAKSAFFKANPDRFSLNDIDTFEEAFCANKTQKLILEVLGSSRETLPSNIKGWIQSLINDAEDDPSIQTETAEILKTFVKQVVDLQEVFDEDLLFTYFNDRREQGILPGGDAAEDFHNLLALQESNKIQDFITAQGKGFARLASGALEGKTNAEKLAFIHAPVEKQVKELDLSNKYSTLPRGLKEALIVELTPEGTGAIIDALDHLVVIRKTARYDKVFISLHKNNLMLSETTSWKVIANFFLSNPSLVRIDATLPRYAFKAWIFDESLKLKKGTELPSEAQLLTLSEELVRMLPDSSTPTTLSDPQKKYLQRHLHVAVELIQEGFFPRQIAPLLAPKFKLSSAIALAPDELDELKKSIQLRINQQFGIDKIIKTLEENPIELFRVVALSIFRGLPHNEADIEKLNTVLKAKEPFLKEWISSIPADLKLKNGALLKEVISTTLSGIHGVKISLSKEMLNSLVNQLFVSLLIALGDNPKKHVNEALLILMNRLAPVVSDFLSLPETQKTLEQLKRMLPLLKAAVLGVKYAKPVVNIFAPRLLKLILNLTNRIVESQAHKKYPLTENQLLVISAIQKNQDLLPVIIPPIFNAFIALVQKHEILWDYLEQGLDMALIKESASPLVSSSAASNNRAALFDLLKNIIKEVQKETPIIDSVLDGLIENYPGT